MDMTCKYCCGELFEANGIFICRSCDKKYIVLNGEPAALVCKDCGGNLLDKGEYYVCELCGKRYKKPQKDEKSSGETDINEKLWKEKFYPAYDLAFGTENAEDVMNSAEILTEKAIAALDLIGEIKSEDAYGDAIDEISAKYLGAVYFLKRHSFHIEAEIKLPEKRKKTIAELMESMKEINRGMNDIRLSNQRADKLKSLSAAFLAKIYNISGDTVYLKMLGERTAGIFGSNNKFEDIEENCPEIAQMIHFCEDEMEYEQKDLTAEYWKNHREEFEKLTFEKVGLEKENERLEQEEKRAVAAEKKKLEAAKKELDDIKDRGWELQEEIDRLGFFRKKEKERLRKEQNELASAEKNLENKVKYMSAQEEKNIDKIMMEYSKKEVDVLDKIFEIEDELDINHYPGEENFTAMLRSEMEKAEKD